MSVPQSIRDALRSAAACVTGSARRSIQAWVGKTYCHGSPRHTETVFGWNRRTVESGIRESESQAESRTEKETRGRPAVEVTHAEMVMHADQLLGKHSQIDPKFQTETLFTRMTGESLGAALAESLDIPVSRLPASRTLRRLMNRRGFSLKKIRKTIPQKKIPQTDAIFHNVQAAHARGVATMTWQQMRPIVWKLDDQYQRGVTLTKSQMKRLSGRLHRLTGLERWCVMIKPSVVHMT